MSEKNQVLVISRTDADRMYLGIILYRLSYIPLMAKTAGQGIHLARKNSPSLIIFDSDLTGDELRSVLSVLKYEPSVKDLPLVVITHRDSPEEQESLIDLGCSAVLTRPIDIFYAYEVLGRLSGQQRTNLRVPVRLKVEIEEGTPEKVLTGIALSEKGIFVRTHNPLPEKTVLHPKFILPHDNERLELAAEVLRTSPLGIKITSQPGMFLRFVDVSEKSRQQIRNFIQREILAELEPQSISGEFSPTEGT